MRLELSEEDLKLNYKDLPTPAIKFEHLSDEAQTAVRDTGKATFFRNRGTPHENYNAISSPENTAERSSEKNATIRELIIKKISDYQPKNGLGYIARFFISIASVRHGKVTGHIERVALLSEAIAKKIKMDSKAAFFAGLLHDTGKIILPYNLFDGHNINQEEYEEVKKHAILGSEALSCDYLFTGLCAGLHHAMYQKGYGLTVKDFPENLSPATVKKVLQISAVVSISDFIEAFTHRTTKIKDGSNDAGNDLKTMLYSKYPDDIQLIDIALEEYPNIKFWNE